MLDKLPVLLAVSVEQEKEALEQGLGKQSTIEVIVCGVGFAAAAANTAKQLSTKPYRGVINIGIAGGFPKRAAIGSIVAASSIIAPEIGAESPEGFISIDELGFGTQEQQARIDRQLVGKLSHSHHVHEGIILSVLTATGTEKTYLEREKLGAIAEAMEGYGVAAAAKSFNLPFSELRTISNEVGVRDKSKWNFPLAFKGIKEIGQTIKEVEQDEYCLFSMSE
ncbi:MULTISPECIES: futalosine hydrolase [Shouchella]|uniref:Futalosine hydrolase n=2 Tax=Shouchella TaxID=2893057 RepID=A0ABY7W0P0_9BACI|nr:MULTISPECIES: futalosine hydrolase [Shouchella]MED4126922.1 futalosine hydrolase [Shouchella miscanthi]WDF02507.1 futalosine hydrolase [Shouchella hunanensis]